jgi:hypothetical protein
VLTHPEHIRFALERAHGGEWVPQELKARIKSVEKAIAQTERQKRRLLDAYLGGVLELPDGRRDALLAQKRQLDADAEERVELADIADSIEKFCEQVRAGLASATFEHKRALVELLIDRVIVTEEEVEIRYVVPTSPEGPHYPFCHLRTDYLPLLQGVAHRRHVGAHPLHLARANPSAGRSASEPERGHLRQPVGEDHRKRGTRGYDGAKKVNGRKRHLLVDTGGLVMKAKVHPALTSLIEKEPGRCWNEAANLSLT